jgi:hypothetical protein
MHKQTKNIYECKKSGNIRIYAHPDSGASMQISDPITLHKSTAVVGMRLTIHYNNVSQPPGRGPVPVHGINFAGPSPYKETIYRAAVSQKLRTT